MLLAHVRSRKVVIAFHDHGVSVSAITASFQTPDMAWSSQRALSQWLRRHGPDRCGAPRQPERESGQASARLGADLAAGGKYALPDNGQPDSGAAGGSIARLVHTVEALEDALQIVCRYARTAVEHFNFHAL